MHIIIPARYDSSRLPGKPLADICGKTLIQRVYDCAIDADIGRVVVATDDERIKQAIEQFGGNVCMTSTEHQSGTDRIAEVISILGLADDEVVVNLQGDEPLMPVETVRQVAQTLSENQQAVMATVCYPFQDHEIMNNPNIVKVVCDKDGYAMYFSRAPIPWLREQSADTGTDKQDISGYRHIGLYAYCAGFVARYASWPVCPPEAAEQLEQLRVLWHGERIIVCETSSMPGIGIDTLDDLEQVRRHFS